MQQIKGAVLKSRLAFVQDQAGKEGLQRVLAAMPEGDQRTLKMLFTSNWYPFELGKALDDAIVRVLGGGRAEYFERLGAASAEKNLTSVHGGFLTKGDAHAFLAKSPTFYALYYETGRREYTPAGRLWRSLTVLLLFLASLLLILVGVIAIFYGGYFEGHIAL